MWTERLAPPSPATYFTAEKASGLWVLARAFVPDGVRLCIFAADDTRSRHTRPPFREAIYVMWQLN